MGERPLRVLSHLPVGILGRVTEGFPSALLEQIPEQGDLPDDLAGDVLLTQAWGSPNLAEVLGCGIRWVHAYGTGVDRFPLELLGDRPLTCSRGASAVPIAEWVLTMLLAAEKRLPGTWVHAPPKRWSFRRLGGLAGRTLGIVGLGGIGLAVAKRALAFDMRVIAQRRSGRPSPLAGVEIAASLDELLPVADHLVLAAPATAETRGLLDAAALARMKPTAHVVNVARGDLIDQDALRTALDGERLALASLDVATPEPLPAGHWLYSHDKVRLSAHTSWAGPDALDALLDPFLANLRRFLDGEPLHDTVDVDAGY